MSGTLKVLNGFNGFVTCTIVKVPDNVLLRQMKCGGATLVTMTMNFVNMNVRCLSNRSDPSVTFTMCLVNTFVTNFSVYLLGAMIGPVLGGLNNRNGGKGRLVRINNSFGSMVTAVAPVFMNVLVTNSVRGTAVSRVFPMVCATVTMFTVTFFILLVIPVPRPGTTASARPVNGLVSNTLGFHRFVLKTVTVFMCMNIRINMPNALGLFLASPVRGKKTNVSSAVSNFIMNAC